MSQASDTLAWKEMRFQRSESKQFSIIKWQCQIIAFFLRYVVDLKKEAVLDETYVKLKNSVTDRIVLDWMQRNILSVNTQCG